MVRKPTAELAPRLRRAYYECRYGQLHLHNAIPSNGGFDELTSVICLHDQGQTGRVFTALMLALGQQRSVYAPDLLGQGQSDPAPGVEPAVAAALAVGDFVDTMRIRRFDLIARGAGCAAARRLLAERPQAVRRLVLIADPVAREPTTLPVLVLSAAEEGLATFVPQIESFLAR